MQAVSKMPHEMANPGWVLVAVAAGLLGIAVLVLARIRRFQARPLRICFFLSILAHVLLLSIFYVSRMLDMPYLPGSQLTFIVDLSLEEVEGLGESESMPAPPPLSPSPPLPSPSESSTAGTEVAVPQADASTTPQPPPESTGENSDGRRGSETDESSPSPPPARPPQLLELHARENRPSTDAGIDLSEDLPIPETRLADQQPSRVDAAESLAVPTSEDLSSSQPPLDASSDHSPLTADAPPTEPGQTEVPVSTWSSTPDHDSSPQRLNHVPRRYRDRLQRPTVEDLKRRGGSPFSEKAVESALQWLAKNQSADGRWDPRLHGAGQGGWIDGQHRGSTGLHADTGITGLALLAFLASGHTHQAGAYQSTVQDGLDFLITRQTAQGNLGGDASIYAQMYCHGIATLALCEALALTGDESLKPATQRAIAYTIGSQHRGTGGWRYRPGDPGDTSQFGWQLMAIVSARESGLDVPENVDLLMTRFLESVRTGDSGGLAAYRVGHPPSHSMTAEALACRGFLRWRDDRSQQEAIQYIMTMKPGVGPRNFYFWYYATIALRQLDADEWPEWNHAMQGELLKTQRRVGPMAGSWDPTTVWGRVGGRVYTTAMATLCLQSYYRYAQ